MNAPPPNFYNSHSRWLGHLTFAVLGVMAFVFFKERILLFDTAFQSFMVLKGEYHLLINRFGATMTLVFPIITAKLGGSLQTVLIAYSLSFVLVHWLMFWICYRILKQAEMAFAIVLFNVFMVNNTFFWVQNECVQAISLGFVFWAFLLRRGSFATFRGYDYLIFFALLTTLVYFHPLFLFPFGFVALYFLLEAKESESGETPISISLILAAVGVFIAIAAFKHFFTPNTYDSAGLDRLKMGRMFETFFMRIHEIASFKDLMAHLWTDFALLPISLLAITTYYISQKKILKLLLLWVFVLGYILIILISYRNGGDWFHVESQYLPMSVFLIVPLVWEFIPALSNSLNIKPIFTNSSLILITSIFSLAILFRVIDIFQTQEFYKKRVEYIGELLEKTKKLEGTKFMLDEKYVDRNLLLQTWGFGYESLYYSALQSPDSMRTIVIFSEYIDTRPSLGNTNSFVAVFNAAPYSTLNQQLFHQTDTVRPYRLLEAKDLQ